MSGNRFNGAGGGGGSAPAETSTTAPPTCAVLEPDTQYPGNDLRQIQDVEDPDWCCYHCRQDAECVGWSFGSNPGEESAGICFLKGSKPRSALTRIRDPNFVSGLPEEGIFVVADPDPATSLFCFSLVVPWSDYEPSLLKMQYEEGASVFQCDGYMLLSNTVLDIAPGVQTNVIGTHPRCPGLRCPIGGEFKTALNTPVFFAVWDSIIENGVYKDFAWTVKADPDAVFFPQRLQALLANHQEAATGTYLNNCRRGMHGPLEVFSRMAVQTWSQGRARCIAHFQNVCSGDCKWGEDMFIDQCLWKVLGVTRKFERNLLVEDHCDPPSDWQSCENGVVAALHPFKTLESWRQCMDNADAAAGASS